MRLPRTYSIRSRFIDFNKLISQASPGKYIHSLPQVRVFIFVCMRTLELTEVSRTVENLLTHGARTRRLCPIFCPIMPNLFTAGQLSGEIFPEMKVGSRFSTSILTNTLTHDRFRSRTAFWVLSGIGRIEEVTTIKTSIPIS